MLKIFLIKTLLPYFTLLPSSWEFPYLSWLGLKSDMLFI